MKIGHRLRKIFIKIEGFLRNLRELYGYLKNYFIENSLRRGDPKKIKGLLVLHNGALGDTYNFIGVVNRITEKYPKIKVYCMTRDKNKDWWKNPYIKIIDEKTAEDLILKKKINALVAYGDTQNLIDTTILFKIKYRSGKLLPYKTRKVTDEVIPMFKKLGFEIDKLSFYFTKEGESAAAKFYKKNDFKRFVVIIQVGSGKTIRALKENKIPSHLWNPNNWAIVADYLIGPCKRAVIFTGVEEEKPMIQEVIKRMKNKNNFIDISGKYSIEEVASIAKRADFAVGIDSGIIHVLSQIGIPVGILFAGDPKISAPFGNSIDIWSGKKICNGCRKYYCVEGDAHCINKIDVMEVIKRLPIKSER